MTFIGPCLACRHGRHDLHVAVPKPGWPGVIGSRSECHCEGECMEDPQERFERKVRELEALYDDPEAVDAQPSGSGAKAPLEAATARERELEEALRAAAEFIRSRPTLMGSRLLLYHLDDVLDIRSRGRRDG